MVGEFLNGLVPPYSHGASFESGHLDASRIVDVVMLRTAEEGERPYPRATRCSIRSVFAASPVFPLPLFNVEFNLA